MNLSSFPMVAVIHSTTGFVHTLAATMALLIGFVIFIRPKATALHRALGYLYFIAMTVMLVTAFCIYDFTKSFNLFHVFAIIACPPLILGLWAAVKRHPGWLARHYQWMCSSYIGLCAAFVAETATRVLMVYLVKHNLLRSPAWFWAFVGLTALGVTWVGSWIVERNRKLVTAFQPQR